MDGQMERRVIKEIEHYANCGIYAGGIWAFTLQFLKNFSVCLEILVIKCWEKNHCSRHLKLQFKYCVRRWWQCFENQIAPFIQAFTDLVPGISHFIYQSGI